jgi:methanogenic corrinoid protein MtbC1
MEAVELFKQYLEHLLSGKRVGARELIFDAHDRGFEARKLLSNIIWSAMEQITKLCREGHISPIIEHMATRINRMVADQIHSVLNRKPFDGRRIVILCGADESAELGAQIASDLFEAEGWSVWFIGSGVANDEILKFLGKITPDLLLVHASLPPEVPDVRKLITLIREIGVCPDMPVMVCGGVYNRVDGLAEEIKADLSARNINDAVALAELNPSRVVRQDVLEPGRRRKIKRKVKDPRVAQLRRELGIEVGSPKTRSRTDDETAEDVEQPDEADALT